MSTGRITIVTGSPGAGKTTLARALAKAGPRGVHVPADLFFAFPAHPIAPTLPEAHEQNGTIIAAVTRTAAAFASGGYEVYLDGIIGPWFLPRVADELRPTGLAVDYVILRLGLMEAIQRATTRSGPGVEAIVRHMHPPFEQLGRYEAHVIDTTGLAEVEVVGQFVLRQTVAAFALDLTRITGEATRA